MKCCIGSGIFALGFAFKNAGMILGPPILVALGLVALHCQHMLVSKSFRIVSGWYSEEYYIFERYILFCKTFGKFDKNYPFQFQLQCGKEVEKHIGRKPDLAETGHGVFEFGPEKVRKMQRCMKIFSNVVLIVTQTGVLCIYTVFFADSMMRVCILMRNSMNFKNKALFIMKLHQKCFIFKLFSF